MVKIVPPWLIDKIKRDKKKKEQDKEDQRPRVYIEIPPEEDENVRKKKRNPPEINTTSY